VHKYRCVLLLQISGTAAKLARTKAYHHFTLLFNTDKNRLKGILHTKLVLSLPLILLVIIEYHIINLSYRIEYMTHDFK